MVTGEHLRFGLGGVTSEDKVALDFSTSIRIPVEKLYVDLFIPPSYLPDSMAETSLLNDLRDSEFLSLPPESRRKTDSLPNYSTLRMLGNDKFSTTTPGLSYYPDLVTEMFSSSGLKRQNYQHFRLTLDYPPLPSSAGFFWPEK